MRNIYKISTGNSAGMRPIGGRRSRSKDNIKIDRKEGIFSI
jgi:hypothetical protein